MNHTTPGIKIVDYGGDVGGFRRGEGGRGGGHHSSGFRHTVVWVLYKAVRIRQLPQGKGRLISVVKTDCNCER